jgi:hypothetical protein
MDHLYNIAMNMRRVIEPKMNSLTVLNGNVVVNTENTNLKVRNIENIESWTDAFFCKEKATKKPIVSFDRVYQKTSKALGVS